MYNWTTYFVSKFSTAKYILWSNPFLTNQKGLTCFESRTSRCLGVLSSRGFWNACCCGDPRFWVVTHFLCTTLLFLLYMDPRHMFCRLCSSFCLIILTIALNVRVLHLTHMSTYDIHVMTYGSSRTYVTFFLGIDMCFGSLDSLVYLWFELWQTFFESFVCSVSIMVVKPR